MRSEKLIVALMLFSFSGCTILENLDEITTLGQYSRNKDEQHHEVATIDDHYDLLTQAITDGHIVDYKDEASFVHSFGNPIFKKNLGSRGERWLYRYAIYRLAKDKVYVYFDQSGKMIKWEKLPCQKFF